MLFRDYDKTMIRIPDPYLTTSLRESKRVFFLGLKWTTAEAKQWLIHVSPRKMLFFVEFVILQLLFLELQGQPIFLWLEINWMMNQIITIKRGWKSPNFHPLKNMVGNRVPALWIGKPVAYVAPWRTSPPTSS